MSKPTLEQQRAQHAWKAVQAIKQEPKKKDLAGHAKKLPMRIKAAGLGQALAFLNAKLEKDNLLHEALTQWVVKERQITAANSNSLIAVVVNGTSDSLRRATEETLAWLEWFNRFAEAEGLKDEQ
jgi:CRISPR-associated protein Cmr5